MLLFGWVGLLVLQPLTVRSNLYGLHRILGKTSYILLPLILIFGLAMLRKEYEEHLATGMPVAGALKAEYLSTVQLTLIGAFYCLAILRIRRRNVAEHMRYMICIALALLPAGLARTLGYGFDVSQSNSQFTCLALIDFSLILLIIVDRRRHAPSQPFAVALAAYLVIEAGWLYMGRPV
jgi:hypothetical protein